MNQLSKRSLLAVAAGISLLLISSCSNLFGPKTAGAAASNAAASGELGSVTVNMSSGASSRSLQPSIDGFAVALSQGGTSLQTKEFLGSSGTLDAVGEGSYTVLVQAFHGTETATRKVLASGSAALTVQANEAASVSVPLAWASASSTGTSGKGGFKVVVKVPTELYPSVYSDEDEGCELSFVDEGIIHGSSVATADGLHTFSLDKAVDSLAPGYYRIQFQAWGVTGSANWLETVWVFDGIVTEYTKTLSAADFGSLPAAIVNPGALWVNNLLTVSGSYGDASTQDVYVNVDNDYSEYYIPLYEPRSVESEDASFTFYVQPRNAHGRGPKSELISYSIPAKPLSSANLFGGAGASGGKAVEQLSFIEADASSAKAVFYMDTAVLTASDLEYQIVQADSYAKLDTFAEAWALVRSDGWIAASSLGDTTVSVDGTPYSAKSYEFNYAYALPAVTLLVRQAANPTNIRWLQTPACPVADTTPPELKLGKFWLDTYGRSSFDYTVSDNLSPEMTMKYLVSLDAAAIDSLEECKNAITSDMLSVGVYQLPQSWTKGMAAYGSVYAQDAAGNGTFAGPLEISDTDAPFFDSAPTFTALSTEAGVKFQYGREAFDGFSPETDFQYRLVIRKLSELPGDYADTVTTAMAARLNAATATVEWCPGTSFFSSNDGTEASYTKTGLEEGVAYTAILQVKDKAGNVGYCQSVATTLPVAATQALVDGISLSTTTGTSGYYFSYAGSDTASAITGDFTLQSKVGSDLAITWSEVSDTGNNVSISGSAVTVLRGASDKTVSLQASVTNMGATKTKTFDFVIKAATTGVISGYLITYNFSSIPNVPVAASVSTDMSAPVGTATSDGQGNYSMAVNPGVYYVFFSTNADNNGRKRKTGDDDRNGGGTQDDLPAVEVGGEGKIWRSASTVTVTAGTTTTVNFYMEDWQ